jgi:predicted dehydrogenase
MTRPGTGKLRMGIVGAGAIARLSCREIASHADAQIVAAADPSAERLAELQAEFAIPRTYADATQLFADADVDAVYIAVPNLHHAPLAQAALEAGKHTLLDKPFATSLAAAEGVAAAARASGKVFMLGMNQRFARGSQKMRQRVIAGDLGEIYHVKAFWRRRSGIPRIGSWFGNKALSGGGGLLDIGVHMLDLALHMIGNFDVRTVTGVTYTKFGNRGLGDGAWGMSERDQGVFDVDDFASAFIRLGGGVSLQLDAGWAMHQETPNDHDVLLYGTEAGASVVSERLFRPGGGRGEYEIVQSPAADVPWRHASRFHHFIDVVLGREAAAVTIEEALAVQRILDAIYASAASGREVAFG